MFDPLVARLLGLLGRCELGLLKTKQPRFSPVFLVCPPRSGSTFISQLLTTTLEVSCFTNLVVNLSRSYGGPGRCLPVVSLSKIARWLRLDRASTTEFQNAYGYTPSWSGSGSDTEAVWNRLLDDNLVGMNLNGAPVFRHPTPAHGIVAALERLFDAPFLDKSVIHWRHIQTLERLFPEALFIWVRRDRLAAAQSVFAASTRGKLAIEEPLLSDLVRADPACLQDPVVLVARWVTEIERRIQGELRRLPPNRILILRYEDVCSAPAIEISRVVRWMENNGAPTRQVAEAADSYPCQNFRKVDEGVYRSLQRALNAVCVPAE